jgi:DNA-directed RNA polymerase subunit beta'
VHAGDYVEAGDPLIRGPIIPHDILRIRGEEALYQYLLTEVQNVYRSQGVKINDKHIEIILNQMLRKVKVEDAGDTKFLPGEVLDKFRFRGGNDAIAQSVRVAEPGGTDFKEGPRSSSSPNSRRPTKAPKPPARTRRSRRSPVPRAARRCCSASPRRPCKASRSSRRRASRKRPRC